jgi:hypothetical protein
VAEVLWVEWKRTRRGKATKATAKQNDWHRDERSRGALTLIAGEDFPATIEGFQAWYRDSGLQRWATGTGQYDPRRLQAPCCRKAR